MKKRLLLALASLALVLLVADRLLASRARDGRLAGMWVPPFGLQSTPGRQEILRKRVAALRARKERVQARGGFHPHYGWINRPGTYVLDGVEHHLNSIGARGERETGPEPPPGVLRVVCFGESFTYGTEVLDGEDWPAQLEGLSPALEVINLGVGGWGTGQALLRWREVGPGLHGDVVFLGLLLENIRRNVNRYRPFAHPEDSPAPIVKPRFRLSDGVLELVPVPYATHLELLEEAYSGALRERMKRGDYWGDCDPLISGSGLAALLAARRFQRRRGLIRLWTRTEEEPFQLTVALLETFHREAKAAGARLAPILIFPTRHDLQRRAKSGTAYWQTLLEELERRGVPYVDLSEALAAEGPPAQLYGASHLTPRGNRVVAGRLLEWLESRLTELR